MHPVQRLLRRRSLWVSIGLAIVYTIFGFWIAPRILQRQIVGKIATQLGRTATLRDVDVNPWTLAVRLEQFRLLDPDSEPFIGFEELFVDFQLSSLFRRTFTFKTVRLTSPHTHTRLMSDEKPNFQDILARAKARPPKPAMTGKPKKPPRLLLQHIEIQDARLNATNLACQDPEEVAFTPIDLVLEDFTTVPNRDGTYTLQATGQGGGHWQWSGSLAFEPMHSAGTFTLTGEELRALWEVIRHRVAWQIPTGVLGLSLQYAIDVGPDTIRATIDQATIALDRFAFREQSRQLDLLALDSLRVAGIELRYPERTVAVQRVATTGLRATAWLRPSRQINWLSVLTPPVLSANGRSGKAAGAPKAAGAVKRAPLPWKLTVQEVALAGCAASFTDSSVSPPFVIEGKPIDIVLSNVSSEPGAKFDIDAKAKIEKSGSLALKGTAAPRPFTADLDVEASGLPMPIVQPYVEGKAKLILVSGDAGCKGRLALRAREKPQPLDYRFTGAVTSGDFLTEDAGRNERLLAWKKLELERVNVDPTNIHIAAVHADGAYGRLIIFQDRRTNIAEVLMIPPRDTTATTAATSTSPPPPAGNKIPIQIDVFRVTKGTADFADLSLLLPFATGIEKLDGQIRGLSSDPAARAKVELDGGLVPSGSVQVRGEMNPLSGDLYTDLIADFRDYDMPTLSPYTGQFLGRKVDQGKLQLALRYQVAQRQLSGDNKLVIDQLTLGADVESPEATSLPVGLAIALLKDRHGKIDLDLPVSGNLDDPKFRIWDAIWDVLRNIVVKLVTAPFSLLGRLIGFGGDSEELSRVLFEPGKRDLSTAEQQKLTQLAAGLVERPQLRLEVRGSVNPELDAAAIREAKFVALAEERSRRDPKKYPSTLGGAGFAPRLFHDLYVEAHGEKGLEELEKRFQVPKRDKDGKPHPKDTVIDEAAFYEEIRKELAADQPVGAAELRALAQDRFQTIKNVLVQSGTVQEERVFLLEIDEKGAANDGLVRVEMKLTG